MKSSAYVNIVTTMTTVTIAMLLAIALSGCNTMKGFGKDVERCGERVQDAAQSTQNKM